MRVETNITYNNCYNNFNKKLTFNNKKNITFVEQTYNVTLFV